MTAELDTPRSTALVTGATGFVGEHLTRRLVRDGWRVTVLVRDPARLSPDLGAAATIITGSLADQPTLARAVAGQSAVFHCAAHVATWDRPEAYRAVNVEGTRNLLGAIAEANPSLVRLVHVSTVDVYGFPEQPCDETAPPRLSGFGYGDSKLRGEALVREEGARLGIPFTIIRPGNVIGPKSQFIARIGQELRSGLMLRVDGGRAHAGLIYVDNLVDSLVWAARAEVALGQCYNARDPHDASWADFMATLRSGLKGRGLVIDLPFGLADGAARLVEWAYRIAPAREPLLHRMLVRMFGRTCGHSAGRIRSAGGLPAPVGYEDGMARSIAWFLGEPR